jgi:hypothetical protein
VNDALTLAIGLLADDAPRNTGPDFGKASPFGLVIVVLLLIGTFLLVRSMNRHLRKLPKSFDQSKRDQGDDDGPDDTEPDNGSTPREPAG